MMEPSVDLTLVYHSQDSEAQAALRLLESLGLKFKSVIQDDLDQNDFYATYSSPTLLKNGTIVFGESAGSLCGLPGAPLPSKEELKDLLSR